MGRLGGKSWLPRWWPGQRKKLGWGEDQGGLDLDGKGLGKDYWPYEKDSFGWQRGSGLWSEKKGRSPGWLFQTLGAVLLFLAVLGLWQLEAPWAVKLQEQLARTVHEDLDYAPVREAMIRMGLWTDSNAAVPVIAMGGVGSVAGKAGLQLEIPVYGVVTQPYGQKGDQGFYPGVSIAAAAGTPVVNPVAGQVLAVEKDPQGGQRLTILWGDGRVCLFGRIDGVTVKAGQQVIANEVVGQVAAASQGKAPSLYWELRRGDHTLDPLTWNKEK